MSVGGFSVPLIFIHGLGSNSFTWNKVIECLPKEGRYFPLDLRGHGRIDLGEEKDFDLEHLSQDVWDLCEREHLERVAFVAHSMGCRIATVAAAQKPERVAGLFLVDMEMEPRPSPHIDLSALEKMRRLPFHFSSEEELDRELLSYGYSEAAISQLKAKNKIYRDPETSSFQVLAHPLTRYLAETKISTSPEAKEAFRKLPYRAFPLKLLIAERESSVTDEGLAWMKATQPDLSCERIEGSDHRIHKTALTTFLATLTTFADSLS